MIQLDAIKDYNETKKRLFIRVLSLKNNREMINTVPHKIVEDLVITYHIALDANEDKLASVIITDEMFDIYGITVGQLHKDALENSPRIMQPEIFTMGALLENDLLTVTPEEKEMFKNNEFALYVATNNYKQYGASVIFYPEVLDNVCELFGNDLWILPSSIHEMLILPDNGMYKPYFLKAIVMNVNEKEITQEEYLSDNIYHYSKAKHEFKCVTY